MECLSPTLLINKTCQSLCTPVFSRSLVADCIKMADYTNVYNRLTAEFFSVEVTLSL